MPAKLLKLLLLLIVQAYLLQGRESGFNCRNSQQPLRLVHRLDGSRFSSSSHYSQFNASQAKISNDGTDNQNDQAWCPNVPLRQNAMSEWIMVTFPDVKIINNLLTAPRLHKAADSGEQSKQLFIQYRRSEAEQFRNYSMLSFSQGKLQSKSECPSAVSSPLAAFFTFNFKHKDNGEEGAGRALLLEEFFLGIRWGQ
uniref:F5/8 type C domain-containing protein n=1 Tax=Macrostomum lignano TaxID=282301 RepID=A0A1I8HYY5_9PLAT